jgi:hypothetical protein
MATNRVCRQFCFGCLYGFSPLGLSRRKVRFLLIRRTLCLCSTKTVKNAQLYIQIDISNE